MKYNEARRDMQTGDVVFYRGSGPFAGLIRWWTKSPWSHVGLVWRVGSRIILLDSSPFHGVRPFPMSKKRPALWVPISPRLTWGAWAEQVALDTWGRPYSFRSCWRVALGLPPRGAGYQCAEYVGAILRAAGARMPLVPTPASVLEYVSRLADPVPIKGQ